MATLGNIIEQIGRRFEIQYEEADNDVYRVVVNYRGGRSQLVNAAIHHTDDGRAWVVMHSVIGPIDDLDPHDLLKRNDAPGYAYIAADDDEAFVQAQIPLENCDIDLCKEMLFAVARFADDLEEELVGGDDA